MTDSLAKIQVLDSGQISIYLRDENGVASTKNVSVNDFINSFASVAQADTGILPAGIKQYVKQGGTIYVSIDVPPMIQNVIYTSNGHRTEYQVPMPRHVWFVALTPDGTQNRIRSTELFIARNALIDPNETLYQYPFGNVHRGGSICWGVIRLPLVPNPASLSSINSLFYSGPFNGDISSLPSEIPFEGRRLTRGEHLFVALNNKPLEEEFPFWEYMASLGTYRERFSNFCSRRF